jgi:methyltransferase (TIGR00027 family)
LYPERPSLTAIHVAVNRAAHQIVDDPKVFNDPIALLMIGDRIASKIRALPEKFQTTVSRHLRAFLLARGKYAEDELSKALKRGIGQYIILGAGLDTFAYRCPLPHSTLRIFEVDHAATQNWKRMRLNNAGIPIPQSLSFVPIDFERQSLTGELRKSGFSTEEPSFFSWLGVTMYLTRDAVMRTLNHIATQSPCGSEIVFDYALSPSSLSPARQSVFQAMAQRVADVGEPWRTFFDPHTFAAELRIVGLSGVEDIGPDELNMRFFNHRVDDLKVGGFAHVMKARC